MKPTPIPIQSICCTGAGYVGGPTMAVIADRCPQVQVTVVDLNAERIAAWNDPDLAQLPVYEPGLDAGVGRARGRNLHFSTAVENAIASANMIFNPMNSPCEAEGPGSGYGLRFEVGRIRSPYRGQRSAEHRAVAKSIGSRTNESSNPAKPYDAPASKRA